MHSFNASTMNFGEVVHHTTPLNKHYWHFLIPPSGPVSESCSLGTQNCGDFKAFYLHHWEIGWANFSDFVTVHSDFPDYQIRIVCVL